MAGVSVASGRGRRRRGPGHRHRAAQVARAVDVAAREADELLLASDCGTGLAERGASVRGVRRRRSAGRERRSTSARRNGQITAVRRSSRHERQPVDGARIPRRRPSAGSGWSARRSSAVRRRAGAAAPSLAPLLTVGGLDGAESSTFRALPWRSGGARLRRQSRPDTRSTRRIEATRHLMALPLPVDPAADGCLPPRPAPHQALHVPAADPGRGGRRAGLRRRVPLPDRKVPIPLGDLDAATPICNACTAPHTFRPDED